MLVPIAVSFAADCCSANLRLHGDLQLGILLLESAFLQKLRVGPDRLAACYHVGLSRFAIVMWHLRSSCSCSGVRNLPQRLGVDAGHRVCQDLAKQGSTLEEKLGTSGRKNLGLPRVRHQHLPDAVAMHASSVDSDFACMTISGGGALNMVEVCLQHPNLLPGSEDNHKGDERRGGTAHGGCTLGHLPAAAAGAASAQRCPGMQHVRAGRHSLFASAFSGLCWYVSYCTPVLCLQADHRFRVRVHVEHEAVVGMSAIALSIASYAASGRLNW